MLIKIKGITIPEPDTVETCWTSGTPGVFERTISMSYGALTTDEAKAVLTPLTAASVTMEYVNPITNQSAIINVTLLSVSCPAVHEEPDGMAYAPFSFKVKMGW
jgi:hypothetical protein